MVQVAGSLESKKQVHDAEKPSKDKHTIALEAIDALQTAKSPFVNSQIIARMLQNLIVCKMVIAQGYEICHLLIDLIYFRYVYLLFQSPYFKAQHPSQEPTLLEKYYIESITVNLIMCFYLPLKRYFLEDSSTKKFGKSTIAQIEELNNSQNDYSPITEPTLLYKMFIKYKKSKDLLTLWSLVSAKCSIFLLLVHYEFYTPTFVQLCLLLQCLFSVLRIVPVVQFTLEKYKIIAFELIIEGFLLYLFYKYTVITTYLEMLLIILLITPGVYAMLQKLTRMHVNHNVMKNMKKFHTRMKVEMLAIWLIIPYFVQKARKRYISEVNRAFPGTRIA